jgi:hypothetical protein
MMADCSDAEQLLCQLLCLLAGSSHLELGSLQIEQWHACRLGHAFAAFPAVLEIAQVAITKLSVSQETTGMALMPRCGE